MNHFRLHTSSRKQPGAVSAGNVTSSPVNQFRARLASCAATAGTGPDCLPFLGVSSLTCPALRHSVGLFRGRG